MAGARGLGARASAFLRPQRTRDACRPSREYRRLVRILLERLAIFLAVTFAVLALLDSSTALLGAIAAVAVVALVGSRYAAVVLRARSTTVGSRARAHRELLQTLPAPSHP